MPQDKKTTLYSQAILFTAAFGTFILIIANVIKKRLDTPKQSIWILEEFFHSVFKEYLLPGILLSIIIIGTLWLARIKPALKDKFFLWATTLSIFLTTWTIYIVSAYFINIKWWTPKKSYFPDLASAFLQGKTYLDTPQAFVDLTRFNDHWYVSFPPLASLLMLPQTLAFGANSVNTIYFTIFFGAVNTALVYVLLYTLTEMQWIKLKNNDNLWMTALFGLGTVHWYMSLAGQVWYISQILTVTFAALAVILALRGHSPISIGIALAIGILARPNIILLWFLLFAIFWNRKGTDRFLNPNQIRWVVLSGVPLLTAILGLLWYNAIRFNNPFDFGYALMNVGDHLKPDLKNYGQFNIHFLLRNLTVFLFGMPYWNSECGFWGINGNGLSVLITTPSLIYLYRARKNQPWVLGAWTSTILLFFTLMLYFNTGGLQFGYRFLMDMIIPIIMLLAFAAGERLSLTMKLLILCGILVNYYGILWFFTNFCN